MKIKYLGPAPSVNIFPYGSHARGDIKEYPEDFAEDLLSTSNRNKFEIPGEIMERPDDADPGEPIGGFLDTDSTDDADLALKQSVKSAKSASKKKKG